MMPIPGFDDCPDKEPEETRNSKVLESFVKYCQEHPGERFWQALRNWSGYDSIKGEWAKGPFAWQQIDTFHFEGRRHDEK